VYHAVMENQFARSELLLGPDSTARLAGVSVAVFGLGGVGSFVAEALARAGIGRLVLVDHDVVTPTNLNRQLVALHSTIGRAKVDVMRERILDINPSAKVDAYPVFFGPESADVVPFSSLSYVADCVDTVSAKLLIIERARAAGVPVLSSMGTGNKLDASRFAVASIEDTEGCPLARVMRRELRKRGISGVKVLFSREPPVAMARDVAATTSDGAMAENRKAPPPGSVSFVPSVAGLLIAGEIVRELLMIGGSPRPYRA